MNKGTLTLLGVVAALGAITFAVTRPAAVDEIAGITVPGYATAEQLEEEKGKGIMDTPAKIEAPVDGIEITRDGETIRLARDGEGDDATWRLTAPIEASAVKYQVDKIVAPFKTETVSVHAKRVKADQLARFDLEPALRIGVKLTAGGQVYHGVDWIVGAVQDAEVQTMEAGAKDTWVLKAGDESVAYRIGGKDLRSALEVSLTDLRDKKIFASVKAGDVVSMTVTSPAGEVLELTGARTETPAEEEGKPPKVETAWTITKPPGFEADKTVDAAARSLSNLRAKEFVPLADAPEGGLGAAVWKLRAKTHDGVELAIDVADADGDEVWAQVPGAKELIKLDKWNAGNLRKTVADVRDRDLFDVEEGAVTRLQFAPEGGGPVVVDKRPDGSWGFTMPEIAAKADPSSHLRSIVTATATRFARASEMEAAKAALAAPEFDFVLGVGSQRWTVQVGANMAEGEGDLKGKRWARVTELGKGTGDPLLLADYVATRFRKGVGDLRSKKPFDLAAADVARLVVAGPDGATVELERPADGGDLQLVGVPEGKKAKDAAVRTLGATLSNLRAKEFADGSKPEDVGLVDGQVHVVTATAGSGASHVLWISAQKKGEDPYAMAKSGPMAGEVFVMNKYQVDNLLKQPSDLVE